jgi:hypothetical protein
MMSESGNDDRPTVADVDPSALAVNSLDDSVRVAADPTESELVDSAGETLRVDQESDGGEVLEPGESEEPEDTSARGGRS